MKAIFSRLLARLRQPKWRHGKRNALLMAVFLLICVLVNAAVGALETAYGWRRDMSFNQYATLGETTQKTLAELTRGVEMYLLYQNDQQDERVLEILRRYRSQCAKITVLPTDIVKNPGVLTRFTGDSDTALAADSVVVSCPDTGRYQVLDYGDFFTSGYNIDAGAFQVEGLAYEKALTEAILSVSRDDVPTAGLLQGHGELTEAALAPFITVLQKNGLNVETVNLLGGQSLEGVDLLLLACPQKDWTDGETETIRAFTQNGGSLLALRDYTDPIAGLPNYFSLLRNYGVIPLDGVVVAGKEDTSSYYGEQLYLLPYLCELDMTLPLIMGNFDVLLMPAASAFETPGEADSGLSAATLLKTGPHAYLRNLADGVDSIDKQEGDREGELSVGVLCHRMHANGNVSRMIAIGNSTMFTDEYIYQSAFNEQFIAAMLGTLLPESGANLDISAQSAFRPALRPGSQTLGVALLIALPLLTLLLAACVLLPRKNR